MIRYFQPEDFDKIKKMHEKYASDYPLPDPSIFLDILVLEDGDRIPMAVATRVTTELYLFIDETWETPGIRAEALKNIHEVMRRRLVARGVKDVHTWLPPSVAKSFGRRLSRCFGWIKSEWVSFSRSTEPVLQRES